MTDREYIDNKGQLCPRCGSTHISTQNTAIIYTDHKEGALDKCCKKCEAEWTENWMVIGYDAEFK